jgi:hypothetical protein
MMRKNISGLYRLEPPVVGAAARMARAGLPESPSATLNASPQVRASPNSLATTITAFRASSWESPVRRTTPSTSALSSTTSRAIVTS